MAAICHHFVQNAWKKDLCSNCFKSKEEHSANGGGGGGGNESRSRYLATMYPSRAYSWRREEASPQSILKDGQSPSRKPKGSGVRFPPEESQVIGFGGEECFSSDGEDNYEPIDIGTGCDEDMMVGDGEEERALQKLTRNNTDFNTVAANLLGTSNGETKRSFTQLMLGKPLTDADGRRKTLLVSVTPFGGQDDADPPPVSVARKTHVNKLLLEPQEKTKMIAQGGKNSDIPLDKSGDIVLKSITIKNEDDFCKIEESSNKKSTDEDQSNNEINKLISKPVDTKEAISKDITIKSTKQRNELVLTVTEETLQRSEETVIKTVLQEVSNIPEIKSVSFKVDCDQINGTPLERSEGVISTKENVEVDDKSSRVPCLRNRLSSEKPKTIIRTAAFNGRSDLQAKTEEIVPKPAIRKSCELNKGSETTTQKDEVHSVSESTDVENQNANKQTEDYGELDEIKLKKEVENSAKQTLITSNSSNQDMVVNNNQKVTLEKNTETEESQESIAKQELTETNNKLSMSNQKSTTEFIEMNNSVKQVNSTAAIVETHNLEVRTTEILTKSVTVENKTLITSNETENKLNKLDDLSINAQGDTHKMEIKFEGGSYKKLHIDEPTVQKEVSKNVSSLSVRKIEGDMFVNSVTTSVQGNDYKVAKIVVGSSESEGGKKLEREELAFRESRELAGEPDGRADPDEASEPPELPQSPPPLLDPRPSFLHSLVSGATRKPAGDKPKIPVKPNKVLQVSSRRTPTQQAPPPVLLQQQQPPTPVQTEPADSALSDANGAESGRTPKRQAPKPPPPQIEESAIPLFTRNPSAGSSKSYSPVSREKEKRERASSCSPKIRDTVSETPSGQPSCPEPAPRRSISLSIESLTAPAVHVETEKKKSHGRARFSLRKFLRLGGSKDEDRNASAAPTKTEEVVPAVPLPRPRLEIIHPLDLNGSAVEVVRSDGTNVRRNLEDSASTSSSSSETKEAEVLSESNSQSSNSPNHMAARPNKPPPPPRNQSLDAWGKLELLNKPARPPPPKSAELLRQQKQPTAQVPAQPTAENNLYVNLAGFLPGEGRSGLAPSKPQRTASIRDAHTDGPKRKTHTDDSGYEAVELGGSKQQSQNMSENVYECVGNGRSSSPECDAAINKPVRYGSPQRKSEGSMDTSPEYLKFRGSFVRSTSLPYCGSETESDIYSPYSFYGSEEGGEEDGEWPTSPGHPYKTCRLRLRKGRSIVHKSLEDNYGAVIVANHEALAQVLEQVNQFAVVPLQLRGLKTMTNLRWTDFTIAEDNRAVVSGRRAFHAAQWASHNVTVCIAMDQGLQSGLATRGPYTLAPLTEFSDLIPTRYLPIQNQASEELVQASVAVLSRLHVDTIHSYGCFLRERATAEEQFKDAVFVMLQLVNGLKALQAQGIEETPLSLSSFVLCREDRDPQPRLCLLHELGASLPRGESGEDRGSLCQCALAALGELLPAAPLTPLVADILTQERAVSLSQVKSVLEFSLWGPADVALGAPAPDRELALQRWLDLERATVLHGLVRTRVELTPLEECHLLFLVRTSSKMMSEASLLLDSQSKPETTPF